MSTTLAQDDLATKLKLIEEAMKKAQGDPKKEEQYLAEIVDPQDNLNCEGCQ